MLDFDKIVNSSLKTVMEGEETDELELMSFEWAVDDALLFEKWKEAGFPLNWKLQ